MDVLCTLGAVERKRFLQNCPAELGEPVTLTHSSPFPPQERSLPDRVHAYLRGGTALAEFLFPSLWHWNSLFFIFYSFTWCVGISPQEAWTSTNSLLSVGICSRQHSLGFPQPQLRGPGAGCRFCHPYQRLSFCSQMHRWARLLPGRLPSVAAGSHKVP